MDIEEISKNKSIRHIYDENLEKWYFSIVDTVGFIAETTDARNYWKVLKNRLKKTQNQLVTECNQHKMPSNDGKSYLTDTGDQETILKIVEMISPEYIPYFEQYFDTIKHKRSSNVVSIIKEKIEEKETYPHPVVRERRGPQPEDSNLENEEEMELSIDGYKEKNFIIIEAFIAGVDINNLSITSSCKKLIIRGKRDKKENHITEYGGQELLWGKFSRTISLPDEIDINKIEATESRGHLIIKLPLIDKSYSKKLKIESF